MSHESSVSHTHTHTQFFIFFIKICNYNIHKILQSHTKKRDKIIPNENSLRKTLINRDFINNNIMKV